MLTAVTFNPVLPRGRYSRAGVFSAPAAERNPGRSGAAAIPARAEDILLRNVRRSIFSEDMIGILLGTLEQINKNIITFRMAFFNESRNDEKKWDGCNRLKRVSMAYEEAEDRSTGQDFYRI
jgi:hypothetical protein